MRSPLESRSYGNVFAAEGLDGSGKSTTAFLLAKKTGSAYYSWKENRMAAYRDKFENVPPFARYLFYLLTSYETFLRTKQLREKNDVIVDRTIVSTIAYHKAMNVPALWFTLVPRIALDQLDVVLYFTADRQTRQDRMTQRSAFGVLLDPNDQRSLILHDRIDQEYRKVIPNRTLVIDTTTKPQPEIVRDLEHVIYERARR